MDSMLTATKHAEALSTAQIEQQLQRILNSETLRNSVTLQNLLQYLVVRAIEGCPDGPKEYTIGVEAFGRKSDFDPKTDTIVRVQTHRLRQKLKEYYEQEGLHDAVVVEIPKGNYCPVFRSHPQLVVDAPQNGAHSGQNGVSPALSGHIPTGSDAARQASGIQFLSKPALLAIPVLLAFALGYFAGRYHSSVLAVTGNSSQDDQVSKPVKAFWTAFLNGDKNPIIAYPNAVFLLDDSNDLLRFRQGASDNRGSKVDMHLAMEFASNPRLVADAGQLYYEDGYTGTGELVGVSMLTSLFAQMGITPVIKTSRNITPEDLQQHSVVLLGSPFQNIAVGQMFAAGDFSFQNPDSHREQWRGEITNAHPENNESAVYRTERDPETEVLRSDYSLISIQRGLATGRNIAIIGGLDTKGTEGATRFICSSAGVDALSSALASRGVSWTQNGANGSSTMPWFQALILVHLEKGDQVLETELTTVHRLPAQKSSQVSADKIPPRLKN
jgi:hypothetical protein